MLAVPGNNKKLQVTFDGEIQQDLTLPNDKSPGVMILHPPIYSSTVKIEVKSVYTRGENGFAAIRIWTSGRLICSNFSLETFLCFKL